MPKYLTSGWERFSFIVTPSELEEIIKDFHLLIISRHVPYAPGKLRRKNIWKIIRRFTPSWQQAAR